LAGLVGLVVMLPWLTYGLRPMLKAINDLEPQTLKIDCAYLLSFGNNIFYYISNMSSQFSVFLIALFIISFCLSAKTIHRQMFYLALSALGGILVISFFRWLPLPRYVLPVAVAMAIYTGRATVNFWQKPTLRPIICILAATACFTFIETNFAPYPLPQLSLPQPIKDFFGIPYPRRGQYYALAGTAYYPMSRNDWGHDWVLQTVKSRMKAPNEILAIMTDTEEVGGATYVYLCKRDNLTLSIYNPRRWTMSGDEVSFNPDFAKQITWYLLETKRSTGQASHFSNKESENNYDCWCSFVRKSGKFCLVGVKPLPDNNALELYKNVAF
jgi:hypothetical protein